MTGEIHAVTGAFGYSGRAIAERLLERGNSVVTLTNHPRADDPLAGRLRVAPLEFEDQTRLAASLAGARVLYNTYWVRFNYSTFTYRAAVENTLRLFAAAHAAGVERIVHVSITNPSEDSPFEYFRGKARLERALREWGPSYAILRPAVLFGGRDILINNLAWLIRRFPVFGVFGDGSYRLQPIHVDDLSVLAVERGAARDNATVDAIGPETFTYRGLVETIAKILGKRRVILRIPPSVGHALAAGIGPLFGDVLLTRDEIGGLMADLLCVDSPPTGRTRLTSWAEENRQTLGNHYASELARRAPPQWSGRRRGGWGLS